LARPEAEESTRRVDREAGVPLKLGAGRKRTEEEAARKRPVESERPVVGISDQEELPLACHCHLPWADVAGLAVMTTPSRELAEDPPEMASAESLKELEKSEATGLPVGAVASSKTGGSAAEPEAIGASLTGEMDVLRETVAAL